MRLTSLELPGLVVVEPKIFGDARGYFFESWNQARYREAGLPAEFVQDNFSLSSRGVLRGLHLQNPSPQGKLVSVLRGQVRDVAVDVRLGSPTFGQWASAILSEEDKRQLWVPPGFAHGFVTLKPDQTATPYELRTFARDQNLANFKVPREIFIEQELPHSPTGKVLKRVLADKANAPGA